MKRIRNLKNFHAGLALVALCDVVLASGAGYILYDLYRTKVASDELAAKGALIRNEESNEFTVRNFIRNTDAERKTIDGYFIKSGKDIVALLEKVEMLADAYHLSFVPEIKSELVTVEALGKNKETEIIRVKFQVEGAFHDVYNFLWLIENLELKLVFRNVEIKRLSTELELPAKASPRWHGSFVADVMSYRPE